MGKRVPAADRPLEIPREYVERIRLLTLEPDEICRLINRDKSVQAILREMEAAERTILPTAEEREKAMARARQAIAEVKWMRSARQRLNLRRGMLKAQLKERVAIIVQRNDLDTVERIRKKLGVNPGVDRPHAGASGISSGW